MDGNDPTTQSPPPSTRQLTGDEAALYDRQIRLWGLEAQQRLSSSRILLSGDVCSLLGHEIAKNVVLAGVACVGLADTRGDDGKAEGGILGRDLAATVASLKDMNPLVEVRVVEPGTEDVADFSIVCAIGLARRREVSIAERCRRARVPFMTGRTAGLVGWVFLDLGERYRFQVKKVVAGGKEAETVEREAAFSSYSAAMEGLWGREARRGEFGWHVAYCVQEFEDEVGRLPGAEEDDVKVLLELYERLCGEKKAAHRKMELMERVARTAYCCLPPVSAIVGGVWAREVIKFVSGKDEPLNNFFFFNAGTSAGSIERIG